MTDYLSEAQINDISDFQLGLELLFERNLLIDGIDNLDDIREILMLKYHSKPEYIADFNYDSLYTNYRNLMNRLNSLKNQVKSIIELPEFQQEIEHYKILESEYIPNLQRIDQIIQIKEFRIFIIGENGAGKNTFIKLFSNEKLPVAMISLKPSIDIENTCIKSNQARKKPKANNVPSVELQSNEPIHSINSVDNRCSHFIASSCTEENLIQTMNFDFISNSVPAFIFILNASESHGLTSDAIQLIENVKQALNPDISKYTNLNQNYEYYSQNHKAIFIFNHWDTVKQKVKSETELQDMKKIIIHEVKSLWMNSDLENNQIFFISATQACAWAKNGIVQTDIISIRNRIKGSIENLYDRNLTISLGLLNRLLLNIEREILVKINNILKKNSSQLNFQDNMKILYRILGNLQKEMDGRKIKIQQKMEDIFQSKSSDLTTHLKSVDVETNLLTKTMEEINKQKTINLSSKNLTKLWEMALRTEVNQWATKTEFMKSINKDLNDLFNKNLVEISNQLSISDTLMKEDSLKNAWELKNQSVIITSNKDVISKIEKFFVISTMTILFPIVALAGLLATPHIMLHVMKEKKNIEEKLLAYNHDPEGYLRKLIRSSLKNLSSSDVKINFFTNIQKICNNHIQVFDSFISIEIEKKRLLIKSIENEKREISDILKSLNSLLNKVEQNYGEYHLINVSNKNLSNKFFVSSVSIYDKLFSDGSMISNIIAESKHSIIFTNEHYPDLTFKMYKKKFFQAYARYQMHEVDLLIKALDECILRCKTICYMEREQKILLVLDKVDCTLNQYFQKNPQLKLTKQQINTEVAWESLTFVVDICIKISKGLKYLHSNDPSMNHPELNLDTILIRKIGGSNNIKIFFCDAQINSPMLLQKKMDGNETDDYCFKIGGYEKENIYKFGCLLYKLVFSDTESFNDEMEHTTNLESLQNFFEEMNIQDYNNTTRFFKTLITICLSEPVKRPTIDECINLLKDFQKKIKDSKKKSLV